MREGVIINALQQLSSKISMVENSARLGITGEAVRAQAFQNLLIAKGIITEQELTDAIGDVIKKANEAPVPAAEAPKTEIVTPTAAEVQAVEQSKTIDAAPEDPTKLAVES